jgi:hypothetical protein
MSRLVISTGIAVAILLTGCAGPVAHGTALAGGAASGGAGGGGAGGGGTGGGGTGGGGTGNGGGSGGAGPGGAGHGPARGRVTGRLLIEGGAMQSDGQQPGRRPLRGTVWFATAGQRGETVRQTVRAGASGVFSAWLPPGRYVVSGGSPRVRQVPGGRLTPCARDVPATVRAGQRTRIAVICIVP